MSRFYALCHRGFANADSVSSSVEANLHVVDIFTSAASFSSDFLHTPKASHAVLQQLPNQATYIFDTAAGSPSDLSWWP